jgi:hypothetical protein
VDERPDLTSGELHRLPDVRRPSGNGFGQGVAGTGFAGAGSQT